MSGRNSATAWLLAAALTLAGIVGLAAETSDPVEELRDRQQRLSNLEYAIKEAELLHRLCELAPQNPECAPWTPEEMPGSSDPATISLSGYRLIEVFGSEGRYYAVLESRNGERSTAQSGSNLAPGLTVNRIRPDSVEVLSPVGTTTLHVGDD